MLDSTGLAGIPDELLGALASRVDIFSRVTPSNKLQIVSALQRAGLIVAMTGDGVNDGPALRASNVGIAMGRGGSELAREVADIVLLEDDVGALLEAVAEGRTTADDIRKSVHFIVSTNLNEILFTLGGTALGFGVPLTATQLLWINLLTDVFPELALAVDPADPDVLRRLPRAPDTRLVSSGDYWRLSLDATVICGAAMTSFLYGLRRYGRLDHAGTMAFLALTGAQLLHAFSSRSATHSVVERKQPPNPWLGLSVAGGFAVQGDQGISDVWLYLDAGQLVQEFGLRPSQPVPAGAKAPAPAESWRDRISSSTREVWLAGLGALVAAGEQGERLFHTFVDQGRRLEESWRQGPTPASETVEAKPASVTERARRMASTGQEYIRDVATGIRGRLDRPTRQEFEELRRKIDDLAARAEPSVGAGRGSEVEHTAGPPVTA